MIKINLYGFGGLGKKFYKYAKNNKFEIINIFDKNQIGKSVDDIIINTPFEKIDGDIPVIITILTENVDLDLIKDELKSLGYTKVFNILEAVKEFNLFDFEHFFVTHPSIYDKDDLKEKIETVRKLLSDDLSILIFDEIINSRKNADLKNLNEFTEKDNHYLPTFILEELSKYNSVNILDLGACYGVFIRYLKQKNINISNYIGFEPDLANVSKLKNTIQENNINGMIYPVGVANFNGLVGFELNQGVSSSVNVNSNDKIMVTRIDDVVLSDINFVKIDIEGFENEALEGMQELIKKNKPILAISIYHKPLDFIDIPLSLSRNANNFTSECMKDLDLTSSCMEYKNFYIRYHEKNGYELVLYIF